MYSSYTKNNKKTCTGAAVTKDDKFEDFEVIFLISKLQFLKSSLVSDSETQLSIKLGWYKCMCKFFPFIPILESLVLGTFIARSKSDTILIQCACSEQHVLHTIVTGASLVKSWAPSI